MPGILPMKVIKIGTNAQTRIAQACDRCRSKKIRCDGIRPCCTQCANVGFECKTSDKLSRRAFPRGYTESLEERVRSLEAEVRELKELLDEKDEKIDLLSRLHSHSPQSFMHTSPRRQSASSAEAESVFEDDESFRVRQSPYLLGDGSDSYFAGTSSACNFIESFKQRAVESTYPISDRDTTELLPSTADRQSGSKTCWLAPPRMLSDQLVNIYFQEWAPLFPVLHRPAFLKIYEKYVADPDAITDSAELAYLNLVFAIAATSSGTAAEELDSFDIQWRTALDLIIKDSSIETLQALVLAQIHCLQQHNLTRLLTYKGVATGMSTRLGLHQVQKTFALDTLTSETRKKLFWTLYTVDCFSSVVLGLPKHIKDTDVFCEYPVDADDEYISEKGFQPTLPGESTKISSALALFKAARILSRVLDQVFPAKVTYELSLKTLSDFSDELELWEASLPAHLRLPFAQDKPSTGTITSRASILSLVYHYIRALIQRPAIGAPSLGNKASSALLIHASSCKKMIQIIQLLDERNLSFSLCLNKIELLVLCGVGTLFQRIKLDPSSKILKDNKNTLVAIHTELARSDKLRADAFRSLAGAFVKDFESATVSHNTGKTAGKSKPSMSRSSSDRVMLEQSSNLPSSARRQLKAIASRFSATTGKVPTLATQPNGCVSVDRLSLHPRPRDAPLLTPLARSSPSINGSFSDVSLSPTLPASRPLSVGTSPSKSDQKSMKSPKRQTMPALTNLDYLSFGNDQIDTILDSQPIKTEPQPTDWERLLGDLDNGTTNIFDASYGGQAVEALADTNRPSRTAMSDAALAWNAGLLTLKEPAKHSDVGTSVKTSDSLWSASSDEGLASLHDGTDWTSMSSNEACDSYNAPDMADFTAILNFDTDFGSDWQENLVTSVA